MLNDSNFKKIKLIIWDLDDTLWEGILAEGEVKPNEQAFELIKRLNQRGIVSSICSKNDRFQVVEYLKRIGSLDDFVFMSINYDSKAPRISKIIDDMNLRAENCLFVDDNERNLGEVSFVLPSIMTSTPDIIGILLQNVDSLGKNDADLSRLKQYKVLEKKVIEQEKSFDEVDFLKKSNIRIAIKKKFDSQLLERVCDLGNRAHQLNYTKVELTPDGIKELLKSGVECAAIECKDKFGDYGFIGFYAFNKINNKLVHFFFSCRTLGMHIEQYIYQKLGFPSIDICEPVTVKLLSESNIDYIEETAPSSFKREETYNDNILIIGPCDLEAVDYFLPWNAVTEFRHFDDRKRLIAYGSHPLVLQNAIDSVNYSKTPFFNPIVQNTTAFSGKYDLIIYSYITALLYGEYRSKKTGESIVFGEWSSNATDLDDFHNGNHIGFDVNENEWAKFRNEYEFLGRASPTEQAKRIINIVEKMIILGADVCLILGSEIPFYNNRQKSLVGAEDYAKSINDLLISHFKNNGKVFFVNPTLFIRSQNSYNGSIQHYSREIYKMIADAMVTHYDSFQKSDINKKKPELLRGSPFKVFFRKIKRGIRKVFFYRKSNV